MQPPAASSLLRAWEQGTTRHAVDRALLLLSLACPELDREGLAAVCIGQRDDLLLELRSLVFGDRLPCFVSCPACDEALEFDLPIATLRDRGPIPEDPGAVRIELGSLTALVRLPDSRDLAAAAGAGDAEQAATILLERLVRELREDGQEVALADLDPDQRSRLSEAIGDADPRAETRLDLVCHGCGHHWRSQLDIAGYLWSEVEREVHRLADQVDRLARVYGWSEAQVLGMSRQHRQLYLDRASR